MTILDILNSRFSSNANYKKALEVIKENYISLVNDNYTVTVNPEGEILVKIPSLEKRNEFVFKPISDYEYPLLMCMNVEEINNKEYYDYIYSTFMKKYKDKFDIFVRDVITVDTLIKDIKSSKETIEYISYVSILFVLLGALSLCLFNLSSTPKLIIIIGIITLFALVLYLQFGKNAKAKRLIDGYLANINTEWYRNELRKKYAFLCNLIG